MGNFTRRDFMRRTTLGAAGILVANRTLFGKSGDFKCIYQPRMAVNPDIDNLRVVCGVNKAMINGDPSSWNMEGQNKPIDGNQVERTLDAIACALSRKDAPDQAWKTIFRKPVVKEWSGVKAAIKVNCEGKNHPRIAVVNKVCVELHRLGVPFGNIIIYDGCSNAQPFYTAYAGNGLPAGIIVSEKNKALGGTMKVTIPDKKHGSYACTRAIADGTIDILVNIAVNKSQDEISIGATTLTLKNHAGTFNPYPIHFGGGLDYMLAFNRSDAFWGGAPVRQQLCIVDSLWASAKGGPAAVPDHRLDRLVMGTFSGAVDYLTARKIREPLMSVSHGPIDRFVRDFGYEERESGDMVLVSI
jgi:hypothetical protein